MNSMMSISVANAWIASAKSKIRFLDRRSAIIPAKGETRIIGNILDKVARERIKVLPVSSDKYHDTEKLTS